MHQSLTIAAQIRAGRALVNWTQQQLATVAQIAVTSIRDVESEKRGMETKCVEALRDALERAGVVFTPGSVERGPGVHLTADRPHLLRRPSLVTMWHGLPFLVEWQGKQITVCIAREAIQQLGRLNGKVKDQVYIETFDHHRQAILDGVCVALRDPSSFDYERRLHVGTRHLASMGSPPLPSLPTA